MPRQRIPHNTTGRYFPADFPQRRSNGPCWSTFIREGNPGTRSPFPDQGSGRGRQRDEEARTVPQNHPRLPRGLPPGLSWAEIARRVGADIETVRRWRDGRARPNAEHLAALYSLAESLGLGHLFRD